MRLLFVFLLSFVGSLHADVYVLPLGEFGNVLYIFDDQRLSQIDRLSKDGELLYTHSYRYNGEGHLISENLIGDLGEVFYDSDIMVQSPYSLEICEYDDHHNLLKYTQDKVTHEYQYNDCRQLILKDQEQPCFFNTSGQIVQRGNTQFKYDENSRLTEVITPNSTTSYTYDLSGKRISKISNGKTEHYVYFGINEIAILDESGKVEELRIPGLSTHKDILRPIAIEVNDTIYAPIHNRQGNILKLIDISTKEVISLEKCDPFGRGLSKNSPTSWIFAGKNYDRDTGLIYFGERYYCPEIRKWLTCDPLQQSADLHQYCLDNPLSFIDPDGNWAVPILSIAWGGGGAITAPVWAPFAAATATGMFVGYLGYKLYKGYQHWQEEVKEPPFSWENLGDDPTICPGEGFVWKGRGDPLSGRGSWVKGKDNDEESLHPDLYHGAPVGPHWDYEGPLFPKGIRIKPDGTWEPKGR